MSVYLTNAKMVVLRPSTRSILNKKKALLKSLLTTKTGHKL